MKFFARLALLAALLVAAGIAHAQTTITALPAGSALTGTEPIPMDQTGSCSATGGTCKTTPSAIATYIETFVLTPTGSPANGNLAEFSGSFTLTNGNLSGDVTTTNSLATTIASGAVTDAKSSLADKPSVGLACDATCGNLTLSGAQTIDGALGVAGQTLVLATAQTTASQNGPWVMQSGAWTRPTWYPTGGTTQAFQFVTVRVRGGTVYADSLWGITTTGAVTIDTTATTWTVKPKALNATTVSGTLPVANGGTGTSTVPTSAQIPIGNAGGTAYSPQTVGGDGTLSNAGSLTVTKTNGTAFGTFATQNYATPPAIGGTTPAAFNGTAVTANNLELAASQSAAGNGFYNASAGNQVNVSINGASVGDFTSTGLNSMSVGTTTAAPGAFTTLATAGTVSFVSSPITISGNISSAATPTNGFGMIGTATPNYTDTSGTGGTIANIYLYAWPAANLETTTNTTYTNASLVNIPAPTCSAGGGGTPTCTNKWSLATGGGALVGGNMTVNGTFTSTGNVTAGAAAVIGFTGHGFISSSAAANITLGNAPSSTPINYTFQGMAGSGSNIPGANVVIEAGPGTGNATGSTLTLSTPHAGSTGSSAQSLNAQITLGDNTVALNQVTTGTNADFVCLNSSLQFLIQASSCTISSERFKEHIYPVLRSALNAVKGLVVSSFVLKDGALNRDHNARLSQVGLLAENVAKVMPECAIYESDMKTVKSYRPECITAFVAKAVQEDSERQEAGLRRLQWEIYALVLWCLLLTGWSGRGLIRGRIA